MRKLTTIFLILFLTTSAFGQFFAPNQKPSLGLKVNGGHSLSKSLVFFMLGNEGSGGQVFDLSGNGYHGIFGAGAASPSWVAGKFGSALNFDGGDHFATGTINVVAKDCILSAWINPTVLGDYDLIIDGDNEWFLGVMADGRIWGRVDRGGLASDKFSSVGLLQAGQWQHIAVRHNSGTGQLSFFYNGVWDSDSANAGDAINLSNGFVIGASYTNPANLNFNGKIDLPMVYNRAPADSEVALLYQEPFCFMVPSWNWNFYVPLLVPPAAGVPQVIFIN